jgi:hypothetical protein
VSAGPEIRIAGEHVLVEQGRRRLQQAPLGRFLDALLGAAGQGARRVLPRGTRMVLERRDAVALAVEVAPGARRVRWLADDSRAPFGRGARYVERCLSFPWLILLVVLRRGELTGLQQLYYRNESLDAGEELRLPNLYNVAEGHGLRCWLCLQHASPVAGLPFARKLEGVVEHLLFAAFNRSAELHEGNSYWGRLACDPRVATLDAWEAATRENALFALEVPWQPAGTTLAVELEAMLDRVAAPLLARRAEDLCGLVTGAAAAGAGR